MIHAILVLLSSLALTRCQVIPGGSCDVKTMAENNVLMKIRELTLEVSSCKEKSLATERLLYDVISRLTNTETQFATYRNDSLERQIELESQQRDLSAQLIRTETEFSNYRNESFEKERELENQQRELYARLIRTETEFSNYRNDSIEKQRELESAPQMTTDRLKEVVDSVDLKLTGKHIRISSGSYLT